ncbi:MAG: sulfotransferase family protein, partial [Caulobacteraceae bacterium]
WIAAGEGRPDWEAIFAGYASMVDHPGCKFWRELADYYPDAKVIHSVRDPLGWFESTQATIFAPNSPALGAPEPMRAFFAMATSQYGGRLTDRDFMVDYFVRHTERVIAAIPKERLLVFEARQGWGPLCEFLGVPAPDTPFPRENTRDDFQARVAKAGDSKMRDPEALKAILDEARPH